MGSVDAWCDWPGCKREAVCTSGNYGGRPVCGDHFKITNGTERDAALELLRQAERYVRAYNWPLADAIKAYVAASGERP